MSTGEVADVDAILAAAAAHDVITLADASQAAGWLPLDATRFDYLLAVGYKWLISPRGTAWMAVAPERLDALVPAGASWFATGEPYDAFIGPPLRLADDARRLDGSPAWFSWVGSVPALELLEAVGIEAIHEHDVGLANRFRAAMGMEPGNSAIVTVDRRCRGAARGGRPGGQAGRQRAGRIPPLQRRRGRRPGGRRPPKGVAEGIALGRRDRGDARGRVPAGDVTDCGRRSHRRLVLELRQPAELPRQVPVAVAEQLHRRRAAGPRGRAWRR